MSKRCPHCQQPMPEPKKRVRMCFDCQKPIGAHGKWTWAVRQGIQTAVHRHCDNPNSYEPAGARATSDGPLFVGSEQQGLQP